MINKVADEHTEIRMEERVIEIEPERLRDFEAHPLQHKAAFWAIVAHFQSSIYINHQ